MVLKRVGVGSAAKLMGAMYAAFGVIFGVILALASLVGAGFAGLDDSGNAPPAFIGAIFGVGAIIILPILYGVLGLVAGAISAALYNLFAKMVGGLSVELE